MFVTVPLLLATSALAVPNKRTINPLTVSFSSTPDVASPDALSLVASVTNTGSQAVKVLKYGTILDNLPSRSFKVTKDGKDVSFTGAKLSVKISDSAYTTIPAGQTVNVTHSLGSIYDFASVGAGKFAFAPSSGFHIGQGDSTPSTSSLKKVEASTDSIEVNIGSVSKRSVPKRKRAVDACTDATKKKFIDASYTESKELANDALDYINSKGADDELFQSYWGSNSESAVTDILSAVADEDDDQRTLNCDDEENACDGNVIAYTLTSTTDIYFCDIFFDEVATASLCSGTSVDDRDIRGGTTLHEMTHAVGGTDDVTYGCSDDQNLSDDEKIMNADSFNCFVTQVYADTQC